MQKVAILLAAGEGVRMKSALPKVLHPICGAPMLVHAYSAVEAVCPDDKIVVVGHGKERIMEEYRDRMQFAVQDMARGKGTGAAVIAAQQMLAGKSGCVIVTAGDMPLVLPETLRSLMRGVQDGNAAAMLTDVVDNPFGYGRVVRENGAVVKIVEQKDLVGDQEKICEMNASVYCFDIESLLWALPKLSNRNAAGEYYLTDVIGILTASGKRVTTVPVNEKCESMGVNNRVQLADAGRELRRRINRAHMRDGVTLIDPEATYIDYDVTIGRETVIYPGCVIERGSIIGEDVTLLPGCRVSASRVGNGAKIESSVLTEATVGEGASVGPFAYLRPGAVVGAKCRIGDFVEIKNSNIGDFSKVPHLSYVGDSDVGKRVNIGCGAVFVNYDGKRKTRSCVEDEAFIGCNVNLVSPVTVGRGAYIAAGSTITQDVPPEAMAIARERQTIKSEWVRKRKEEGKL